MEALNKPVCHYWNSRLENDKVVFEKITTDNTVEVYSSLSDDRPYYTGIDSPTVYFDGLAEKYLTIRNNAVKNIEGGYSLLCSITPLVHDDNGNVLALNEVKDIHNLDVEFKPTKSFLVSKRNAPSVRISSPYKLNEIPYLKGYQNKIDKQDFVVNKEFPNFQQVYLATTGLKFGVEIEVANSKMNHAIAGQYGFIALKDGSLPYSGEEFTSIPLKGFKGISYLRDFTSSLRASKSTLDLSCALHVHVELPQTKTFIVCLYYLYYRLQYDILDLMPAYIKNQSGIAKKQKSFAEPIPGLGIGDILSSDMGYAEMIDECYRKIFEFYMSHELSRDTNPKKMRAKEVEPEWSRSPWRNPQRYYSLNLTPYFTGQGTAEFRVHPPTLDEHRMTSWVTLLSILVKVAANNASFILASPKRRVKISWQEILQACHNPSFLIEGSSRSKRYRKLAEYLKDYLHSQINLRLQQERQAIELARNRGQEEKFRVYVRQAVAEANLQEYEQTTTPSFVTQEDYYDDNDW